MAHKQTQISSIFEKKNNAGRSMVEMLGTLAVMGVLAVGGIMGYRYAMDKYRANQTINDVNLRANTIELQLSRGIDISLNEFDTTATAGYAFEEPVIETDETTGKEFVKLSVQGLEKSVCQIIKKGMPTYEIIINDDVEATNCADLEGGNVLAFLFEKVGDADTSEKCDPEECYDCHICQEGACVPQEDGTDCSIASALYSICLSGTCTPRCRSDADCFSDEYCADAEEVKNNPFRMKDDGSYNWYYDKQSYPEKCQPIQATKYQFDRNDDGVIDLTFYVQHNVTYPEAQSICQKLNGHIMNSILEINEISTTYASLEKNTLFETASSEVSSFSLGGNTNMEGPSLDLTLEVIPTPPPMNCYSDILESVLSYNYDLWLAGAAYCGMDGMSAGAPHYVPRTMICIVP